MPALSGLVEEAQCFKAAMCGLRPVCHIVSWRDRADCRFSFETLAARVLARH